MTTIKDRILAAGHADPNLDRAALAVRLATSTSYVCQVLADAGIRPTRPAATTATAASGPVLTPTVVGGFADLTEDAQEELWSAITYSPAFEREVLTELAEGYDPELLAGLEIADMTPAQTFTLTGAPNGRRTDVPAHPQAWDLRVTVDHRDTDVDFAWEPADDSEEMFAHLCPQWATMPEDLADRLWSADGNPDAALEAALSAWHEDRSGEYHAWANDVRAYDEAAYTAFEKQLRMWARERYYAVDDAVAAAYERYNSFEWFAEVFDPDSIEGADFSPEVLTVVAKLAPCWHGTFSELFCSARGIAGH